MIRNTQISIPTLVRVKEGAIDRLGIYLSRSNHRRVSVIAMEICGSSRPASGSEHLISHALDVTASRPRLHGLQVGVASYIVSQLQGANSDRISSLFNTTGFWNAIAEDPFSRGEWLTAVRLAPTIKANFFTVLSTRDVYPEVERLLFEDEQLRNCFHD